MNVLKCLAAAVLATTLIAGCSDTGGDDGESTPTLSVDSSLTGLLVTKSDFTENWTVQDISDKMAEQSGKQTGEAVPAECDSSDKTSLTSGVGATVSKSGEKVPGVIAALSREKATTLIPDTEKWLDACGTFSVKASNGATAEATVRRIDPPASKANAQVGFEMTTTSTVETETVTLSIRGYTAQVGDVVVMCLAMGGKAASPTGRDIIPDVAMLDAVFTEQVTKVANGEA